MSFRYQVEAYRLILNYSDKIKKPKLHQMKNDPDVINSFFQITLLFLTEDKLYFPMQNMKYSNKNHNKLFDLNCPISSDTK